MSSRGLLFVCACLAIGCAGGGQPGAASPAPLLAPSAAGDSRQLLVVVAEGWSGPAAVLQRYERDRPQAPWRPVGAPLAAVVGRNGLGWGLGLHGTPPPQQAVKREGDGKAPAGLFRLGTAFGYAKAAATRLPYLALTAGVECIDDAAHPGYNTLADRSGVARDWSSSERMRRDDELYRLGVVVEHNASPRPIPGRGSCIFLHVWRGPDAGTAGCTALSAADVESLLGWLDPAARPLLLQLPAEAATPLLSDWGLALPPAAAGT
jgi:L,D-peptidoglycan transpeptidase YkuD (ErfK/YbiS/YcfS/YnhG family)